MSETIKSEARKLEAQARPLAQFSAGDLAHDCPQYNAALKIFDEVYGEANGFLKSNPGSGAALASQIADDRLADPSIPRIDISKFMFGVKPLDNSHAYFGRSLSGTE